MAALSCASILCALVLLLVAAPVERVEASPCQYCKYCQFCSHCASCPCEPAPNNFCSHCKYCKYCSLCSICDTACNEDTVVGSLFGKVGSLFSRGSTELPEDAADVDAIDNELNQKLSNKQKQKSDDKRDL